MTGTVQGLVLYLKYFQVTQPKSTCFHDTVGENGASESSLGIAIPFGNEDSPGGCWNFWGYVKEYFVKAIKVSNNSQIISTLCFTLRKGEALRKKCLKAGKEKQQCYPDFLFPPLKYLFMWPRSFWAVLHTDVQPQLCPRGSVFAVHTEVGCHVSNLQNQAATLPIKLGCRIELSVSGVRGLARKDLRLAISYIKLVGITFYKVESHVLEWTTLFRSSFRRIKVWNILLNKWKVGLMKYIHAKKLREKESEKFKAYLTASSILWEQERSTVLEGTDSCMSLSQAWEQQYALKIQACPVPVCALTLTQ